MTGANPLGDELRAEYDGPGLPTPALIARRRGLSVRLVRDLLTAAGADLNAPRETVRSQIVLPMEDVLALANAGVDITEIARLYHVLPRTVQRHLDEHNRD